MENEKSLATNVAEKPHLIHVNSLRSFGASRPFTAECMIGNWWEQRIAEQSRDIAPLTTYSLGKPLVRRNNWQTMYDTNFKPHTPAATREPTSFAYTSRVSLQTKKPGSTGRDIYSTTNKSYGQFFHSSDTIRPSSARAKTPHPREFSKLLREAEIVPDVEDPFEAITNIQVSYNGAIVTPGEVLTPTDVQDPPKISFQGEPGCLYTLVMTDPDAPSRKNPTMREWVHWVVCNIPGDRPEIAAGNVFAEYVGAGPPSGTGLHRYIFILYKQTVHLRTGDQPLLTNRSTEGRAGFKARELALSNSMKPIAATWFVAEYDDYVPLLYKQLSGK